MFARLILTFSIAFSIVVVVVVEFEIVRAVVERKRGHGAAAGRRVDDGVEVDLAEQTVVAALTELVAGDQLTPTDDALEALDVVDLVPGAHHEVVLGERDAALGAPRSEQPAADSQPARKHRHVTSAHLPRDVIDGGGTQGQPAMAASPQRPISSQFFFRVFRFLSLGECPNDVPRGRTCAC